MQHSRRSIIRRDFHKNWAVYLIVLPVVLYYLVFQYLPMGGALIAFERYSLRKGIFGSQWVGFANFTNFFNSATI